MTITPRRRRQPSAGRAAAVLVVSVVAALVASLSGPASADPRLDPRRPVTLPSSSLRAPLQAHAQVPAATAPRAYGRVGPAESRVLARRGVRLVECKAAAGGYCGTLEVPVDRAHPARGTVRLFFLYFRHREPGPARSAIMLSEGGPGYSVTNTEFEKQAYLDSFGSLMARRDLVMLDQRGVGRSGVIKCPALQRSPDYGRPSILRKVAACAERLGRACHALRQRRRRPRHGGGAARARCAEARPVRRVVRRPGRAVVRRPVPAPRALGRPRLAVLGVGVREQGLLFDDFGTDLAQAVPEVADHLCARSTSCSAERSDAREDLAWLAEELRASPVAGSAYGYGGRLRDVKVTESSLAWNILQSGDFGQHGAQRGRRCSGCTARG